MRHVNVNKKLNERHIKKRRGCRKTEPKKAVHYDVIIEEISTDDGITVMMGGKSLEVNSEVNEDSILCTSTEEKAKYNDIKDSNMNITNESVEQANEILANISKVTKHRKTKVEKKDNSIIERTEDSVILLTEDNKALLND